MMSQKKYSKLLNKKSFLKIFQILVSISFLTYLFIKIDYSIFFDNFKSVNWILVVGIIFLGNFSILISSFKAKFFLKSTPFWRIVKVNYICFFYGIFIPGSITSDLFKFHYYKKNNESKRIILSQVLVDRLTGVLAIFFYFLIGLFFYKNIFLGLFPWAKRIFDFSGIIIPSSILFLILCIVFIFRKKIKTLPLKKYSHAIFFNLLLSFCFQLLSLSMFYLTLLATFEKIVPFSYLFLVIPFVTLIGFIPISMQNIGVSENLYVLFLGIYGFSFENVLFISLVSYSILLIKSFVGYVFFMKEK